MPRNRHLPRSGAAADGADALWLGSVQGIVLAREGRVVRANPALATLLGLEAPEGAADALAGASLTEALGPTAAQRLEAMALPNAPQRLQLPVLRADGTTLLADACVLGVTCDGAPCLQVTLAPAAPGTPPAAAEGATAGTGLPPAPPATATSADAVEVALLHQALDLVEHRVFVKNADGRYLYVNRAMADAMGQEPAAFLGRHLSELDFISADEKTVFQATDDRVLREGRSVFRTHVMVSGTDGEALPWRITKQPCLDAAGRVVGLVGVAENRTRQVQDARDVRDRQRLLQAIVDALPHDLYAKDTEGRLLLVNAAMAEGFGLPPERFLGRTLADMGIYSPEQLAVSQETDREVLATGRTVQRYRMQTVNPRGEPIWIHLLKLPLRDEAGRIAGIIALSQNITPQVEAERALSLSERSQRLAQRMAGVGSFDWDLAGNVMRWGEETHGILGLPPGPHQSEAAAFFDRVHPDDAARFRAALDLSIARHQPLEADTRIVRPSGDVRHCHVRGYALREEGERPVRFLGMLQDITDRVNSELALREQKTLLQTVLDSLPTAISVKDLELRILMANKALADFHGVEVADLEGRRLWEGARLDEGMRQRIEAADRHVLDTGEPLERAEFPLTRHDGVPTWRRSLRLPYRNHEGRITGVIVVSEDITERKHAAMALLEQRNLLQTVLDVLPHSISVKDADMRYQMVNRALADFYEVEPEAFLGRQLHESPCVCGGSTLLGEADARAMATGEIVTVADYELVRPNGTPTIRSSSRIPYRDAEGRIAGLVVVSEDITERKRAERELLEQKALLQTVLDVLPHNISVKDAQGRYRMVNRALAECYESAPEAFLGRTVLESPCACEDSRLLADADAQALASGETVTVPSYEVVQPDRPPVIRSSARIPFRDPEGRVAGLVVISEDITERKRAENELIEQKTLLQTVLDVLPHNISVKDVHGRFRMVNRALAEFFGATPEDFLHHTLRDSPGSPEPHQSRLAEADAHALATGEMVTLSDYEVARHDGTPTVRSSIRIPYRDAEGNIAGLVMVSEDITERKRAADELEAQRRLLRSALDLLPMWVYVKDRDRRVTLANRAMMQDLRLDGEPPWEDMRWFPAEEHERVRALDERVLEGRETVVVQELSFTVPGKGPRTFRTHRMPLSDARGAVVGLVGANEDITERRQTELALQQAQKLESLGVMAGGIAHDFNNLLMPIMGHTELARTALPPDSRLRQPLELVEQAAQRAAELCRQMLAYAGKGTLQREPFSPVTLVQDMNDLLTVSVAKHVIFYRDLAADTPHVLGDPTQMRQVLLNLVINASEAIGDATGEIRLTTAALEAGDEEFAGYVGAPELPAGRYVCIEVSDTGPGIRPDHLARIFEPFFSTKFTGRGLGLATVLGIVRAHHGALRVDSAEGVGTTFHLVLPAVPADEATAAVPTPPAERRYSGTVLLVDDETAVRAMLKAMLSRMGLTVLEAADGQEALDTYAARGEAVRLVLLDLTMPRLGGEETARRLREQAPDLPIVVMSGYSETAVRERLPLTGPVGFLQKPFRLESLHEALAACLS